MSFSETCPLSSPTATRLGFEGFQATDVISPFKGLLSFYSKKNKIKLKSILKILLMQFSESTASQNLSEHSSLYRLKIIMLLLAHFKTEQFFVYIVVNYFLSCTTNFDI